MGTIFRVAKPRRFATRGASDVPAQDKLEVSEIEAWLVRDPQMSELK